MGEENKICLSVSHLSGDSNKVFMGGYGFDSCWETQIFSWSHTHDKLVFHCIIYSPNYHQSSLFSNTKIITKLNQSSTGSITYFSHIHNLDSCQLPSPLVTTLYLLLKWNDLVRKKNFWCPCLLDKNCFWMSTCFRPILYIVVE